MREQHLSARDNVVDIDAAQGDQVSDAASS